MPDPSKLTTAAMPLTNVAPVSIASAEHPASELHVLAEFARNRRWRTELVLESHRSTARVPILITVAKPEFSELLSFTSRPVSTQA